MPGEAKLSPTRIVDSLAHLGGGTGHFMALQTQGGSTDNVENSDGTPLNKTSAAAEKKKRFKARILTILLFTWLVSLTLYLSDVNSADKKRITTVVVPDLPPAKLKRSPYSSWVHNHWIRAKPSEEELMALLTKYRELGIPVETVTLDAGWVAGASLRQLIQTLHTKFGVRVVLFVSALLPEGSELFETAREKKHLLNEGKLVTMPATATRPEVKGGLLDYSSPDAVNWWHTVLDSYLDMGIVGFKNEASDAAFMKSFGGGGAVGAGGFVDRERWARSMYHDFFDYGRKKNGFDFTTMFRPVDTIGNNILQSFGPQDISFASWVGDHSISFDGLRETLLNMFHSTRNGYINIGCAVGGAASSAEDHVGIVDSQEEKDTPDAARDSPVSKCLRQSELFLRWTHVGALLPVMENGGLGENHAPWQICKKYGVATPTLVTDVYKHFVELHNKLAPFFFATGTNTFFTQHHAMADLESTLKRLNETHGNTGLSITPLYEEEVHFGHPDNWEFVVGTDLFVAPVIKSYFDASKATSGKEGDASSMNDALKKACTIPERTVKFPRFGGQEWVRLDYKGDDLDSFTSGARIDVNSVGVEQALVWRRRGAIIPMHRESVVAHQLPSNSKTLEVGASTTPTVLYIDRPRLLRFDAFRRVRGLPPQLRDVYEEGQAVEYSVLHGEHDLGIIASYVTKSTGEGESFTVTLRTTKYTKGLVVAIRGVRCIKCKAPKEGGYATITGDDTVIEEELRRFSRRVVIKKIAEPSSEVWVIDPFSSLGNLMTLGPFEST